MVSEESGAMSLAFDGKILYGLSSMELTRKLKELLDQGIRKGESDAAQAKTLGGFSLDADALPLDAERSEN